jgi:hypothetical protein
MYPTHPNDAVLDHMSPSLRSRSCLPESFLGFVSIVAALPSSSSSSPSTTTTVEQTPSESMGRRLKRRVDELLGQDIGVHGLKVSDFEDILDESTAEVSTICTSSASANSNSNYFCIGGSNSSRPTPCLTRELNQLPMTSREQVGQDLYGTHTVDEMIPPELFELLELEIQKIGTEGTDREAYDLATELSPSYVYSKTFRTMFLRATEGDCKKAAKRFVRHFSTKKRLFGEKKLVKDITLSDLDENDMEALESGGFQVLAERDLAGRSVLYGRYTSMRYRTIDNMLRALWYIWMSILEDPINQIKGVVAVGYEVGKLPLDRFDGLGEEESGFEMSNAEGGFDRDLARQIVSVPLSVPVRPVGYHLCTDSHQWVHILNIIMVTLCKFIRLRMRIHHGSDQECKYALMTHGLPTGCIPVDTEGNVTLSFHKDWIQQRRLIDATKSL